MEWESDVSAGEWLVERTTWDGTMHAVVPHGFEAYARILHAPAVTSRPDGSMPSQDELQRMRPADIEAISATAVTVDTTWAHTAETFGTTLHALAQWPALVRATDPWDSDRTIAPDGREFTGPQQGWMPPEATAALVSTVIGHAGSTLGYAAVWEGFGGLLGSYGTTGRTFFSIDETSDAQTDAEVAWRHEQMLAASTRDPFNNVFQQPTWSDGILSREISEGPKLELPQRSHVLFRGDVAAFTTDGWILHVPWRDRVAESHGFEPQALTPNVIWPDDHSWVIVSEIDFAFTIVGGDRATIDRVLAMPGIEVFEIAEGADMSSGGDALNS